MVCLAWLHLFFVEMSPLFRLPLPWGDLELELTGLRLFVLPQSGLLQKSQHEAIPHAAPRLLRGLFPRLPSEAGESPNFLGLVTLTQNYGEPPHMALKPNDTT